MQGGVAELLRNKRKVQSVVMDLARMVAQSVMEQCDEVPESMAPFSLPPNVIPKISFEDYILRFVRKTRIDVGCVLQFAVLLQRVLTAANSPLTRLTAHRCGLAVLVISIKVASDKFFSNSVYAKVGGVTLQELNAMEVAVLDLIDWQCEVSELQWTSVLAHVQPACQPSRDPVGTPKSTLTTTTVTTVASSRYQRLRVGSGCPAPEDGRVNTPAMSQSSTTSTHRASSSPQSTLSAKRVSTTCMAPRPPSTPQPGTGGALISPRFLCLPPRPSAERGP
eukprot:TRINITY_DN2796_c0_g2_i3.p1 TRINITY_DN2796_c0_g2~~TRINITY_DN2796_c0_g2_i3.p1  ORF type:complete len:279 (+),score=53.94 TRINITY_DN2796_c0_g2_i3:70-906(+)